jgi:predicted HAD superfamily Cof-like phosphohydrolase
MIDMIALWFSRAKPNPTDRDFEIQVGVHAEEVSEMLETMRGKDMFSEKLVNDAEEAMKKLATALKTGMASVVVTDRKEFLDACCDQIVTATGSAHFAGMHITAAVDKVNQSNWSKFDENGMPIFDANGKIAKNMATYKKPDLSGLY